MLTQKEVQTLLSDKNNVVLAKVAKETGITERTLQNIKTKGKCSGTNLEKLSKYFEGKDNEI